ncbi:MAG: hypothetical protein QXU18_03675, partial [Thermoplasmatales archaeon]
FPFLFQNKDALLSPISSIMVQEGPLDSCVRLIPHQPLITSLTIPKANGKEIFDQGLAEVGEIDFALYF